VAVSASTIATDPNVSGSSGSTPNGNAEIERAHLDVVGDLLIDLLIERHTPEPRTERALH
jgi:hypothetical protein